MSLELPASRFTTRRKIEFADTDMGGIVHFARFFAFLEAAEHEFFDALGVSVIQHRDGHRIGWPRVSASLEYHSPARFGDELTIELEVVRRGAKSLTYDFEVRIGDRPVASGRLTTVCCVLDEPGGLRAVQIPDHIAHRIAERDQAS